MSDCGCELEADTSEQLRVLWIVLAINFAMFVGEATAGLLAGSVALLADSSDMLADAAVYGISLYAVRRSAVAKARAAAASGVFQIAIGLALLAEAGRRLANPIEPEPGYMIAVAAVALVANAYCLRLIAAHKESGVHMSASAIFSQNDVIANAAVILGGVLVVASGWSQIDPVVGAGVSILVLSGGVRILREAKSATRAADSAATAGAV